MKSNLMIDNKPLEEQAENYIKSQLIKFDFNIAKPSFDKLGTDLLIVKEINVKKTNFLKIQSKGRSVSEKFTNVVIPKEYVDERFILFIYTIDSEKNDYLYIFFEKDIKKWNTNGKHFTISFNMSKLKNSYFKEREFNLKRATEIHNLLNSYEIKDYTTVMVDGVFLEKAINQTKYTYSKIWPEKEFEKPSINSIIENIITFYDKFNAKNKSINCYVIESIDSQLDKIVDMDCELSFYTKKNNLLTIYKTKHNLVAPELMNQLERLINNDNIILVGNDRIYEIELRKHKELGVEIILVLPNSAEGRNIYLDYKSGDIAYPIAKSLGLSRNEW